MNKDTKVKMFKARKQTKRFRRNQIVWVLEDFAHHAILWHKWQGKGGYVLSTIGKFNNKGWNPIIGEDGFKEIDIMLDEFFPGGIDFARHSIKITHKNKGDRT
jgi:hypothetical protein